MTTLARIYPITNQLDSAKPGKTVTVIWNEHLPIIPGFTNRYAYIVEFQTTGAIAGNHLHQLKYVPISTVLIGT